MQVYFLFIIQPPTYIGVDNVMNTNDSKKYIL